MEVEKEEEIGGTRIIKEVTVEGDTMRRVTARTDKMYVHIFSFFYFFVFLLYFSTVLLRIISSNYKKFESLMMTVNFSLTSSIIFSLLFSLFLFFSLSLSLPPCLFKTQERRALQQLMRGLSDADAEIDAERRRKRSQGASPRYVLCLTN